MEWSHQKIAFLSFIIWAARERNKIILCLPKLCWLCFPFARLVNYCYPRIGICYFVQKPIKIVSNLCFGDSFLLLGSWFGLSYYYLFSYHHSKCKGLNGNAQLVPINGCLRGEILGTNLTFGILCTKCVAKFWILMGLLEAAILLKLLF